MKQNKTLTKDDSIEPQLTIEQIEARKRMKSRARRAYDRLKFKRFSN